MRLLFSLAALYACQAVFSAQAAAECTEIRFTPGTSSAEIAGEAPSNDALCFTIRTAAGQDARIQVLDGSNTIVSVLGVPDAEARQDIAFTTQARKYEIRVGQLMRAIEPQPFRMLVSVE